MAKTRLKPRGEVLRTPGMLPRDPQGFGVPHPWACLFRVETVSASILAIFSTRRACRPPSKGVSSQMRIICIIWSSPSRSAEQAEYVGVVVGVGSSRRVRTSWAGGGREPWRTLLAAMHMPVAGGRR